MRFHQILAGDRLDLPMGRIDAVKSAEAVEAEEKQQQLMLSIQEGNPARSKFEMFEARVRKNEAPASGG